MPKLLAQMNTVNTNIKAHQPSRIPAPERQHIIQKLDDISKHLSNIQRPHGRVTAYFRRESQFSSRSLEVGNRNANFGALFEKSFAIHSEIIAVQSSVSSLKTEQEVTAIIESCHRVPEDLISNKSRENHPSEKELGTTVEQRQQQRPKDGKGFLDIMI